VLDVNGNVRAERVEEEMVFTCPAEPKYAKPCDSEGRYRDDEKVDDAVEKIPLVKPMVVEVEL
jgi:hypothetical protein